MSLSIEGVIGMRVTDLGIDTRVRRSRMRSGQIKIGELNTLCVIRKVMYGNVSLLKLDTPINVSMITFPRVRGTGYTKLGFVEVQITTKPVQYWVYIRRTDLRNFFGNFADCVITATLNHLGA